MLRVVIIDGSAISRGLLSSVLTNGGHHVVGDASASPAGLARMITLLPQIVCIDIGPPENEGMHMLDTLRMALPKSLIFIVSSNIDSVTVKEAMSRGVHGFIVKPFNATTVLATIRNAVLKLVRQQPAKNNA